MAFNVFDEVDKDLKQAEAITNPLPQGLPRPETPTATEKQSLFDMVDEDIGFKPKTITPVSPMPASLMTPRTRPPAPLGAGEGFFTGLGRGVTQILPQQIGKGISAFLPSVGKPIEDIAAKPTPEEETRERGWFEQAGEMLPMSILPAAMRAASVPLLAAPTGVSQIAGGALLAGSYALPFLYGAAQYKQTKEEAEKRGVEPGVAPYVTGLTEWLGETLGTKYLSKAMTLMKPVAGKPLSRVATSTIGQWLKDKMLPSALMETGTEVGQQAIQSATEKYSGIRPEADILKETMGVIPPTLIMTGLTGGVGRMAGKYQESTVRRNLTDPNVPVKERRATALMISRDLADEDPGLGTAFMGWADRQIQAGKPIDLEMPLTLEGLGAPKKEGAATLPLAGAGSLKTGPSAAQGIGGIFGPRAPNIPDFYGNLWDRSPQEFLADQVSARETLNGILQTGGDRIVELTGQLRQFGRDSARRKEILGQIDTMNARLKEAEEIFMMGGARAITAVAQRAEELAKARGITDPAKVEEFRNRFFTAASGKDPAFVNTPIKDIADSVASEMGLSSAGVLPTGIPSKEPSPKPGISEQQVEKQVAEAQEAMKQTGERTPEPSGTIPGYTGRVVLTDRDQPVKSGIKEALDRASQDPELKKIWDRAGEVNAEATKVYPQFEGIMKDIAALVPGSTVIGGPKSVESLADKVLRKIAAGKTDTSIDSLTDHLRGTIVIKDWADAPKLLEELARRGYAVENLIDQPVNHFGYRGVHGTNKVVGNLVGEIQIQTPESLKVKKASDYLYAKWRTFTDQDLTKMDPETYGKYHGDLAQSKKMWSDYWNTIPESSRAAISASVKGRESIEAPTVTPAAGTQALAPESQTTADLGRIQSTLPSSSLETKPSLGGMEEPPVTPTIQQPAIEVKAEAEVTPQKITPENKRTFNFGEWGPVDVIFPDAKHAQIYKGNREYAEWVKSVAKDAVRRGDKSVAAPTLDEFERQKAAGALERIAGHSLDDLADILMESFRASAVGPSIGLGKRILAAQDIKATDREVETILQRAVTRGDLEVDTRPFAGKYKVIPKAAPAPAPAAEPAPTLMQAPKIAAEPAEPKPGEVSDNFPVDKIEFDPERFQYKFEGVQTTGETGSLKGAKTFDKALFGVISIWKDPSNGKWYVVNGHNRTAFAKSQGVNNVPVYHIDAPTAQEARAKGALQNIAEGQGTVIDAAKFFRDSKLSLEDLKDRGISFTKGLQRDAVAMSNLDEWIFKGVINKTFPYERAVVIGERLTDKDLQNEVVKAVEAKEKKGKKITNDVLREVVDQVLATPTKEMVQTDLFGTTTTKKSLVFEKAALTAHIAKELARDKKIFGMVARNAEELARVPGQEIKAEESKQISQDATKLLGVFDALKNYKGPISEIINKGAERLSEGEDAKTVKADIYNQIREALPGAIATRTEPVGGGTPSLFGGPSAERLSVERRETDGAALERIARNFFGLTDKADDAGMIMSDGAMMNLRPKGEGFMMPSHRNLRELTEAYTQNLGVPDEFQKLTGAIRYIKGSDSHNVSFSVGQKTSESQWRKIGELQRFDRNPVYFDIYDAEGNLIASGSTRNVSEIRQALKKAEAGERFEIRGKDVVDRATYGQIRQVLARIEMMLPKGSRIELTKAVDVDLNEKRIQRGLAKWFGEPPSGENPREYYERVMGGLGIQGRARLFRLASGGVAAWIQVATAGRKLASVEGTLWHEAWHSVWDIYLDEKQKAILSKSFPSIEGTDSTELQANAFRDWVLKKRHTVPASVKGIFQQIKNFFEKIGNYLAGLGFDSAESLFGKAYEGKLEAQISFAETGRRLDKIWSPDQVRSEIGPLWHGTPHEFEQFTTRAIGSGEGGASFGWGLYFTSLKDIAKHYAEVLGRSKFEKDLREKGPGMGIEPGEARRKMIQPWIDSLLAKQGYLYGEKALGISSKGTEMEFEGRWSPEHEKEYQAIFEKWGDPFGTKSGKPLTTADRKRFEELGEIRPTENRYRWYATFEFDRALRDIANYIEDEGAFPDWLAGQPYNLNKESVGKAFEGLPVKPTRIVKEVTLHRGKAPSDYTYLDWEKPVPYEVRKRIGEALIRTTGAQAEYEQWKSRKEMLSDGTVPEGWTFTPFPELKEWVDAQGKPHTTPGKKWILKDENGRIIQTGWTKKDTIAGAAKGLVFEGGHGMDAGTAWQIQQLMTEGKTFTGEGVYGSLVAQFYERDLTDHPGVGRKLGKERASLFLLRQANVDGIRYPSGTLSGREGEGTNYVVFDENAVSPVGEERFMPTMADFESNDPAIERQMQEARGFDTIPKLDKFSQSMVKLKQSFFEHFPRLWDNQKFGFTKDILRRAESVPEKAIAFAQGKLEEILKPLSKAEYWGFSKMIILPDIIKDAESGLLDLSTEHPFGYTDVQQVRDDLNKVMQNATPNMTASFVRRQQIMKDLVDQSVALGLLPESAAEDPRYYHHQVMEHMNLKYYGPRVSSEDVRTHRKGYMISRKGTGEAYNTEYLQSEFEVLAQMRSQIMTKETLNELEANDDISSQVKIEAQRRGYTDWRQALKHFPGYTLWQPKKGNVLYNAFSLTEKVVDRVLNQGQPLTWDDLRVVLAVGQKRQQWVIPDELAYTLDNFRDFKPDSVIVRGADNLLTSWKQWILLNPLRVVKYWVNNMSGDADIVFAYNPKIMFGKWGKPSQYLTSSIKDLWADLRGNATAQQKTALQEARDKDVIGSGMTIKEIPDINEAGIFKVLTGANPGMIQKYWNNVKEFNNFRENILRLASYRYFQDAIARGETPYGASKQAEVNAVTDPTLRAAKLARELVGDYGNISEGGQWLRKHMIPFYSWMEINAPRYLRLMKNVRRESAGRAAGRLAGVGLAAGARGATSLGIRATMLYTLVNLWNGLFFPDEEDEMQRAQRNQLHLILGRRADGSIMSVRFQGALSDALNWFGMEDFPQDFKDVVSGKVPWSKKFDEALKAPVQKLVSGARPVEKGVFEAITGKTIYPEMFKPRAIRDPYEHLAKTVAMDMPYRFLAYGAGKVGLANAPKPIKGLGDFITSPFIYQSEPGESAYYSTIQKITDFLGKQGYEVPDVSPTRRSNALYYYKKAQRFGDDKTAQQWLDEYIRLGGKMKDIRNSMKKSHPIAFIPIKLRREYWSQLDSEDQKTMDMAIKWWENTFQR